MQGTRTIEYTALTDVFVESVARAEEAAGCVRLYLAIVRSDGEELIQEVVARLVIPRAAVREIAAALLDAPVEPKHARLMGSKPAGMA